MLVLSRRLGEEIKVGKDITLKIVDIERGKVRIGVTAPREVPVYRSELLKGVDDEDSKPTDRDGLGGTRADKPPVGK